MIQINLKIYFPNGKLLFFFLISIVISISSEPEIRSKFAKDYFQRRGVSQVVSFGCCGEKEKVKFVRDLGTKSSYVSISDNLDMNNILKVNYYKIGVFLDLDCPDHQTVFNQFTMNQLFYNESYYWLLITKKEVPFDLLEKLHLGVNTEMTLAVQELDNFVLYDVYNPSYRHGGKLNVTHLGDWKLKKGLDIDLKQYKYDRRKNFNGLTLNFSLVLHHKTNVDFQTYMFIPVEKHYNTMHRFHYNLILELRDYYNFSIHLARATSWGYKRNGTFDGIIGDMVKGIVDISASPFWLFKNRLDGCDFTAQVYLASSYIMFRHPKKNHIKNSFVKPFTETVWGLMILMMFFICFLIVVTVKIEDKYGKKNYKLKKPFVIIDGLLDVMAATCQQDVFEIPCLYSARIVFISLFVWAFMMYQFYSACLLSSLLSEPTRFINTLEDLINSDLEVGLQDTVYNRYYLASSNDPLEKRFYSTKLASNKKRKESNFLSAAEGLKRVQKGGFAFQVESPNAYRIIEDTFTEDEICDLAFIQLIPTQHTTTVVAKNSPFKKMITYGLRNLVERGNAQRLKGIWVPRKPTCPESHSTKPTPVVLKDFFPLIFMIFVAWIVAISLMVFENVIKKVLHLNNGDNLNSDGNLNSADSLNSDNIFNNDGN